MSILYPTNLDTLTNPTSSDYEDTVSHVAQHANANDAIEALEAKVGKDSSAVATSHDYKLAQLTNVTNTSDANKPVSTAQQTALDLKANIAQEAWRQVGEAGQPAFQNSWVNYGGQWQTAAYMKDSLGFVHLRGLIKTGTIGQNVFTMPAGYRPNLDLHLVTVCQAGIAILQIFVAGNINAASGNNTWFSLDGITFKAEQ